MTAAHDHQASTLKTTADAQSRAGKHHEAVSLYSQALQQAYGDVQLQSILLANRSLALLKTQQPQAAFVDATKVKEVGSVYSWQLRACGAGVLVWQS